MSQVIIGRDAEKKILQDMLISKEAELIAILGRRRVGKTFLVRNYYEQHLIFEYTGVHEAGLGQQLLNFRNALHQAMGSTIPPATPTNWIESFTFLSEILKTKLTSEPLVVLFDEFPWIHTSKSGFLSAFGHWWNTWASRQPLLKVVICGSAASWMIENIINNRGGLHNRVSRTIRLLPFSLKETEEYLISRGIRLDQYQILQLYMAMGGIPQYLKQVDKGESAGQVIDKLFFEKNGLLKLEFANLYRSLFANAVHQEAIVRLLAKKGSGLSRTEIIEACGLTTGGGTTRLFEELEESGFITQYVPFGKTARDSIYKLSDEYSFFYLKFIEHARASGEGTWHKIAAGQSYNSWSGYAFEAICQKHILQIKKALGIGAVYTEASGWRYIGKKGEYGAQIDLLLDRQDHCINLCEIKFSTKEFIIDKRYAGELENKVKVFKSQTKTRKSIFPTMITPYGVLRNDYYTNLIQAEVLMEDLFSR
ncbi:MAG: ATPase [Sphingobacteriales bacterium 50-39]|mgnify:CR=1 FL=1|nr:AAA family ATPase [Sphingobacteriales bacterium]OJW54325.1 MAG: ATPase [Sphingobacteriales bacterium 50-39]